MFTLRASRPSVLLLAAVALVCGVLLPSSGARAATFDQGITGTLSDKSGPIGGWLEIEPVDPTTPMAGGWVSYWGYTPGFCQQPCRSYETEADGSYNVPLAPGQYWVRFTAMNRAPEWWGDSAVRSGTEITIVAGTSLHQDAELSDGATISGNVAQVTSDQDGLVDAWVADPSFPGGYFEAGAGVPDANGDYQIRNLPDASYAMHFYNRTSKLEGWWQGARTITSATPVTITGGTSVSGIDPTLEPYGTFSGRVTAAATGAALSLVNVDVWRLAAPGHWVQDTVVVGTGDDGTYSFPIRSGTYRVRFSQYGSQTQFFHGAGTYQSGEDVVIGIGDHVTGIDAALEPSSPVWKTAPSIAGFVRVGSKLTAHNGTWYPTPTSFSYSWTRDGLPLGTGQTYTPQPSDLGHSLTLQVTAYRAGYTPSSVEVQSTGDVVRGVLSLTSSARLSGQPQVGSWLLAVAPSTTPTATVRYQWYRDGVRIAGATTRSHKLVAADRRHRISVLITLSRTGYTVVHSSLRTPSTIR